MWKLETLELVRKILDIIEDKKGSDILVLDIREISLLADYFVICTAESERQFGAMVDSMISEIKTYGVYTLGSVEGTPDSGWILVDFGDIVVHIFSPKQRDFYALEKLWRDSKVVVHMQ